MKRLTVDTARRLSRGFVVEALLILAVLSLLWNGLANY